MRLASSAGHHPSPPCPLCGGSAAFAFSVADRNRRTSSELFDYHRCSLCETHFLHPVPSDLGRYYPSDYHSHPSASELDALVSAERPKLDLLRLAVVSGSLLELGSGTGLFARAAVLAGFDVTAIEMDPSCCEYIEAVVGARAICSSQPADALLRLPQYQAIAMWHVIEHLENPWEVFEQAAGKLAPGGAMIVATPNPRSLQFRLLGRYWAHVDAPRHLFLIPPATLESKASALGLRQVMITTADPAGRHWNRFGWEYALRRHPATRPTTLTTRLLSLAITLGVRPLESRGLAGAAYTSLFVRPAVGTLR
jgi:2-polyprenyl-3-methyl-5-hydroxy-6-metoxy-1,4-benzoquinol methylase